MEKSMMSIPDIKDKLYDRSVKIVSEATGINVVTISRIKNGHATSCTKLVQLRLSEYFESRP